MERFFRTVREQFLVEMSAPGALDVIADIDRLNTLFTAWVETVYHRRIHSETGQEPLARFLAAGPPAVPTSDELVEAFLWSATRTVTKTATVSLFSNTYEVDAALVGRKVELVFDPFDLTRLHVRFGGRDMGYAIPHKIGRHVHPDATAEPRPDTAAPTGINYLAMVAERNRAGQRRPGIKYNDLPPFVGSDSVDDDSPVGPSQPDTADFNEAGESA